MNKLAVHVARAPARWNEIRETYATRSFHIRVKFGESYAIQHTVWRRRPVRLAISHRTTRTYRNFPLLSHHFYILYFTLQYTQTPKSIFFNSPPFFPLFLLSSCSFCLYNIIITMLGVVSHRETRCHASNILQSFEPYAFQISRSLACFIVSNGSLLTKSRQEHRTRGKTKPVRVLKLKCKWHWLCYKIFLNFTYASTKIQLCKLRGYVIFNL